MNPTTKRACVYCGAHDVWDRVRYLDEHGELTTYPAAKRYVESVVCLSCKEAQPLGPANDTSEVRVEIRAAEIAADWERFDQEWHGLVSAGSCSTLDHVIGMVEVCERDIEAGRMPIQRAIDIADLWAGYLAHAIAEHDAEAKS